MKAILRKMLSWGHEEDVAVAVQEKKSNINSDELVLKIHNEIDSLEEESIKAVNNLLASTNIPTESQVNKKADMMKSLGFSSNNETIKESEKIRESILRANNLVKENKDRLELINKYRLSYPTDKIIPMSEFIKVINKYNLIYAPSKAYIKDIPEKNVLEISNAKRTLDSHRADSFQIVTKISHSDNLNLSIKDKLYKYDFNNLIIPKIKKKIKEVLVINNNYTSDLLKREWLRDDLGRYSTWRSRKEESYRTMPDGRFMYEFTNEERYVYVEELRTDSECKDYILEKLSKEFNVDKFNLSRALSFNFSRVSREGLYIAAPKSHFDMSNLYTSDGREFYERAKVKFTEIKDPIAFYILKGIESNPHDEFVRITSKWGTSDDQSYLDPIVQDERSN